MFIIFAVSFCWLQQMLTWQWGLLWFIVKDIQKCWIFVEFFPIKVLSHFLLPTIMLTRYSKVHIQFTNNCFEEWNIYASRHNEHWLHFIFPSNHIFPWDSGVTLRESIYERINFWAINFCGVYSFEITPPSHKNKFRKVLLFVVTCNSPN